MKRNIIRKNTGLNGISIERQIEIPDYDMTLLKLSTMTPYLEGRRVHKTLDHNKKENEDSNLVVKYNVVDASQPTQLYFYYVGQEEGEPSALGVDMFDKVEIDGTEVSVTDLDAASGTTTQLSVGEHTVAYTLKDPTFIGLEIDEQTGIPTKVGATFSDCERITDVTIPSSVITIGNSAFSGCTGLTSIEIPNSVTSIGDSAFRSCSGLTSVIIPNSVTSIGAVAFRSCSGLTSVTIGDGVTSIGDLAFGSCTGLTSVTIPNSVTSIGGSAFEGCSNLTSIVIPNSETSIGNYAFCGCPLDETSKAAIEAINPDATICEGVDG